MRIILDHDTWVVSNRGREGPARPREYGSKQALKAEVLAPSKHQDERDVPEEMYESNRLQTRSMSQIQALTWHVMTLSIGEGHNLYLSP